MIKVITESLVDLKYAHDILDKFANSGMQTSVSFIFDGTKIKEIEQEEQTIQKLEQTEIEQKQQTVQELIQPIEEQSIQNNFEYCASNGIKEGAVCHIPGLANSQGLIKKLADDYSMAFVKFANQQGPGSPATSHDVSMFGVKLGDKVKWVDVNEIKQGVKPN